MRGQGGKLRGRRSLGGMSWQSGDRADVPAHAARAATLTWKGPSRVEVKVEVEVEVEG